MDLLPFVSGTLKSIPATSLFLSILLAVLWKRYLAQYKYLSGNKLGTVNYTTSRSKFICKKVEGTHHHSGKYYGEIPLNIPVAPLDKKRCDICKQE